MKSLVLDTVTWNETKRAYGAALDEFLRRWYAAGRHDGFIKASVSAFRAYDR